MGSLMLPKFPCFVLLLTFEVEYTFSAHFLSPPPLPDSFPPSLSVFVMTVISPRGLPHLSLKPHKVGELNEPLHAHSVLLMLVFVRDGTLHPQLGPLGKGGRAGVVLFTLPIFGCWFETAFAMPCFFLGRAQVAQCMHVATPKCPHRSGCTML